MNMKQRLMLMLILLAAVPVISAITGVTWVAQRMASEQVVEQVREKLISVRELKKAHVEDFFRSIRGQIATVSKNDMVVKSSRQFVSAFRAILDGGEDVLSKRKTLVRQLRRRIQLRQGSPAVPPTIQIYSRTVRLLRYFSGRTRKWGSRLLSF